MANFAGSLRDSGFTGEVIRHESVAALLAACELVCFGTSAVQPTVQTLAMCPPGATLLHTSLRDLSTQACLEADNVVDDVDHVLQANTALHRTEQETGRRDFVRATLAQVIQGHVPARVGDKVVVYSPFGLAALDLAFAEFVARRCSEKQTGLVVPDFLP
jgi:ornithine cyclodeaminase